MKFKAFLMEHRPYVAFSTDGPIFHSNMVLYVPFSFEKPQGIFDKIQGSYQKIEGCFD